MRGVPVVAVTGLLVAGLTMVALPASAATPTAKVAPSKNLTNLKVVQVSGKGWPAGDTLAIVECNSNAATSDTKACNETLGGPGGIVFTDANAKGVVAKTAFTFVTGTVGDGTCNSKQTCYITLTEESSTGLHALVKVTVHK